MIASTLPVSMAYNSRALVSCVFEAPGKFDVLNMASAGSFDAMPKVTVGTWVWFSSHTWACVYANPAWTL